MPKLLGKLLYTTLYATFVVIVTAIASLVINRLSHADLDGLYINYKQFTPGGTSYLITNNGLSGHALDKELSLHMDSTFLSYFYWNNVVHAGTDKSPHGGGQFRTVGWKFQLGARITQWLDFQYEHHSQHILDHQGPLPFPREDSFGINVYLYRPKNSRESIF